MKQIDFHKHFSAMSWEMQKTVSNHKIGGNAFIYSLHYLDYSFFHDLQEPVLENECELVDTTYTHQFLLQTKPQVKIVL